jgi:hypothetical protein
VRGVTRLAEGTEAELIPIAHGRSGFRRRWVT